jgi:hypothetical protein
MGLATEKERCEENQDRRAGYGNRRGWIRIIIGKGKTCSVPIYIWGVARSRDLSLKPGHLLVHVLPVAATRGIV